MDADENAPKEQFDLGLRSSLIWVNTACNRDGLIESAAAFIVNLFQIPVSFFRSYGGGSSAS